MRRAIFSLLPGLLACAPNSHPSGPAPTNHFTIDSLGADNWDDHLSLYPDSGLASLLCYLYDEEGRPHPYAYVFLVHDRAGTTDTTWPDRTALGTGVTAFRDLASGTYTVVARGAGYATFSHVIRLTSGRAIRLRVWLKLVPLRLEDIGFIMSVAASLRQLSNQRMDAVGARPSVGGGLARPFIAG